MYGGGSSYKVNAYQVNSQTGKGKVYVANDNTSVPNESQYKETDDASKSDQDEYRFRLFALGSDNSGFVGWYSDANASSLVSSSNPYETYFKPSSGNKSKTENYYAKFAKNPSATLIVGISSGGETSDGSVSVSESSTSAGSNASLQQYSSSGGGNVDFYLHATPNEHYVLDGWTTNSSGTTSQITGNHCKVSLATGSKFDENKEYNYYAIFKQLPYFNFSAKATAYTGGTVSSSWTSETVWGTTLNQSSATKDVTYKASLTDQNYYFVGWTATNGSTNPELGTNTSLTRTLTNNTPGSTVSDQVYAIFKPLYQFKAVANKTPDAGGTVKITRGSGTDDINNQKLTSQSNSISDIKFSATVASKYSFTGWSDTETGNVVSANNPYTISITSTSTDPNNPTTKTLWAKFTPFPTFYFKAKGEVYPAGAGTVTVTSETLSAQADAASSTSFTTTASYSATSSDPAIYTFAGWKSSTSASSYTSTDNPADLTLTSTSTNSESPITTTWYAFFTKKADVTSISLTTSSMTLKQKQSATIVYSLLPSGCYEKVEFVSNNTAVATVNSSGSVKGVSQGNTTVTVKAYKTDKTSYVTATVNITVTNEVASQVGMTFTEGTTPGSLSCFDDFNIPNINLTVSNCLIMPGRHDGTRKDPDGNVIVDFKGTLLEGGKSVKLTGNQQLDCETFYFETSGSMPNASLRAYSFTGWHITNEPLSTAKIPAIKNKQKVPAQTVFQPGDVITPEVLKDYGVIDENGGITGIGLTFEALWGAVCFISFNGSFAADNNDGKSYLKAMWTTTGAINSVSTSDDAYSAVLMVLDYYGFSDSWTTVSERGVTYKSLQRSIASNTVGAMEDGRRYTIKTTSGTSQPTGHASYRLDNVKGVSEAGIKSIKMDKGYYIETTARFSGNIGNFLRIENQKIDFVGVLNGGRINGSETFSWSRLNGTTPTQQPNFDHRYFYFGRNVSHGHFFTSCSGTYSICTGPVYTTITGGYMEKYSGTGTVTHTNNGDRYLYIYGDKSGNQEYDPKVDLIQPAADSKLNGNSYVTIAGTTQLNDVYGGGYSYSATVNNAYLDIKESIINGSAYGGGCYGSTTGEVKLNITNSTIKGNVFGSGMGATSLVSYDIATTTKQYDNNTTIPVSEFTALGSLDGFPLYYTAETLDGTLIHPQYSVLAYKLYSTTVWGGDNTNKNINLNLWAYTYHLAMAEAGSTSITINGSTIGTEANKGLRTHGNVYGGGAIAKVLGNSNISISNTTIYSSVYGGGDGIATPEPVYLTTPALAAVTTTPSAKDARESDAQEDLQRPNPVEDPDKWTAYEWTSDISVWNMGGIDYTNHKIYSPNNASNGWGDVVGKTQVTVQGGSHVYGSVYGGGNSGKVGPASGQLSDAIVTTIENSQVEGSVFGGCNNAKLSGATQVKILGSSIIGENIYGGGNAGEVTGTTQVTVGQ